MKRPIIPRIWKMRIVAAILAPTLFLLLVEGVLRLSGYGDVMTFFVPIEGQDKVTGNTRYTYQYFPKQLAREPDLIRIDKNKPKDVYRIFVIGGSAARGTPDPRFGFGRILGVMLEEAYPDRRFEVVNTAIVAINSHVVMRIAEECVDYDPDLFVIYMGNNEAVGPFGVGTKYNEQSPGRGMVALSLAAKSTRIGQLIGNLAENASDTSDQAEWLGMETFNKHRVSATDPRVQRVYDHFQANLKDIVDTARGADIPTILCTVAVNLKNCAPLASGHSDNVNEAQLVEWQEHYNKGIALEEEGRWKEADEQYAKAESIDDHYAELHFRRARCALALDDAKTALAYFETARDLDTLRFRSDSKINGIIRDIGSSDFVTLLDAEKRFQSLPRFPHGIPGNELFYEHVHFRFEGNYELARMVFEETVKKLGNPPAKPTPSLERCAELLGLSGSDRYQMASSMMSLVVKPPFINQLDYYNRCEKLHAEIRSLKNHTSLDGLREAERKLTTALELRPDNLHGRMAMAQLQLRQGKASEAENTTRELMKKLPNRADLYLLLGQTMLEQDRKTEAEEAFATCINIAAQPLDYMAHIAKQYEQAGDKDRALALMREAVEAQPKAANRIAGLAEMLLEQGKTREALEKLEQADSLLPDNGNILFNLSRAYYEAGDMDAAIQKLRETLEATPFHLGARMQLGLALKNRGDNKEASRHLNTVIKQEPDKMDLRLHLAEIKTEMGRFDEAEADYREMMKRDRQQVFAVLGLAWTLAVRPDAPVEKRDEAVALAQQVVSATGQRAAKPLDVLAAAYASSGNFEKATQYATKAVDIALLGSDPDYAFEVSKRLNLYKKKKPYHLTDKNTP